jgi:hypothetical protein
MRNEPATVSAPRKPHGKFKLSEMRIRPGVSGGFTAEHSFEPTGVRRGEVGGYRPSETHVIPHMKALQKHVAQHFSNPAGGMGQMPPAAGQEAAEAMPEPQPGAEMAGE